MKTLLLLVFGTFCYVPYSKSELSVNASEGCIKFAAALYTEIAKSTSSNFLISPMSLKIVLFITSTGANGNTYEEISKVLYLNEDSERELAIVTKFLSISDDSSAHKNASLITASKIYIGDSFKMHPRYKELQSKIQAIDFSNAEQAAQEINKWVEEATRHKIKDMFSSDDFSRETVLILLNALYFRDTWLYEFDKADTKKEYFHVNSTKRITIEMMSMKTTTEYYKDWELRASFLKLPYKNAYIAMYLVVPDELDGIYNLEKQIDKILATKVEKAFGLYVKIPKFTIKDSNDFKSALQNMGIKDAFGENADFSKMLDSKTPSIKINAVKQNTIIEVDEQGTTAAAATSVSFAFKSIPPSFIADRPFIFYIKYGPEILFVGRFCPQ